MGGMNELEFLNKTIGMLDGGINEVTRVLEYTVSKSDVSNLKGQLLKLEQMKEWIVWRKETIERGEK